MRFDIVIPFYKNYETIERLLMSIYDQDYKEFAITIVVDGEDEKAGKQLTKYLEDGKYSFNLEMLKKNSGASKARNHGAVISSGDNDNDSVLFFIDADCTLMPGILFDYKMVFELYPDISFSYSNYRFNPDKTPSLSQGFDPYLLETMNYISTMSPVKRKAFEEVGGFDNDRKYFQDWGLFLKLARAGKKGHYLGKNVYGFSTEKPTEDSLSGSQGMSLSEKSAEFRKYYGIEDKEMVVTTWGAPLQAIQRAKMLKADYAGMAQDSDRMVFPCNYQFPNWKYTYVAGCYNQTLEALENHITCVHGRPVYHFIGTDVYTMYNQHGTAALRHAKQCFEAQDAIILANSSRCQKELKECGIDSKLVFTPIYNIDQYNVKPLPEKFTVGIYVSASNMAHKVDDYSGISNIPLLMDVAKAMPDIEFKFFGIENRHEKKGNIEFCGRIPESHMVEFIHECSMVIRSTSHDGFPQLPIQYLLCGRQALVSCPDPEMKYVERLSFEENIKWEENKSEIIDKIYEMEKNGFTHDIGEVTRYYKDLMSEEVFRSTVYSLARVSTKKESKDEN